MKYILEISEDMIVKTLIDNEENAYSSKHLIDDNGIIICNGKTLEEQLEDNEFDEDLIEAIENDDIDDIILNITE